VAKTTESGRRSGRAELQDWYLGNLRPRLADAVTRGIVEPAAAAALDRELRDFLELPEDLGDETA